MPSTIEPPSAVAAVGPWWSRTSTMLAFMVMSTIPLWFSAVPPLIDFLGHMARYHVALDIDHDPLLARNWSYHWALIGNLGVDLLIMPVARLVGLPVAVWLVAAGLPALMIWGIFRAGKAVYGTVPPTVVAALPFTLAYPYQYGFVNFWLGSALGFHAFAWWVRLHDRERLRSIVFVPVSLAIWVCHVYGWAIFGTLVGGYELARVWPTEARGKGRRLLMAVVRTWPLLTVVAAMVIWRANGQGAVTLGWFNFQWKVAAALLTLRDQWKPLDIASLIAATLLIYTGVRNKAFGMDARFGFAALLLVAALIVIPYQLFGSAFADVRVYPFLFITAILAVRIDGRAERRRLVEAVTAGFAALFAVRILASSIGYAEYDAAYQRHLAALDHIPRGAGVAVLVGTPCVTPWRLPRVEHLGSLALMRRDAFVNSQWDVPGAELLRARRAVGTSFNVDPSQFVADVDCHSDLRPKLAQRIAQIPRRDFDYLWVFNFDFRSLPSYPGLRPLYHDESTALYRLSPEEVAPSPVDAGPRPSA